MIRLCAICGKEFDAKTRGKYCSQDCFDEARRIRNRERWRAANPGWGDRANKTCEWCGESYEVRQRYASQSRFCSDECGQTWYSREIRRHGSREEYIKERTKQKEERQIKLKEEREQKLRTVECAECGQPFETMQPRQLTCSTECSRLRRNRLSWQREENRYNDTILVDKDISLKVLYKRDKGICYICGGKCDFKDHTKTNGNFTAGPTYPSIDHLIPIARGGMHAWDNVKLAHHLCNSKKSDILPSELELDVEINDAYALAIKVSPRKKQVRQFTKDGKLIAVYESTIEASKQTGLKAKGIQNCARGERPSQGGYLWSY